MGHSIISWNLPEGAQIEKNSKGKSCRSFSSGSVFEKLPLGSTHVFHSRRNPNMPFCQKLQFFHFYLFVFSRSTPLFGSKNKGTNLQLRFCKPNVLTTEWPVPRPVFVSFARSTTEKLGSFSMSFWTQFLFLLSTSFGFPPFLSPYRPLRPLKFSRIQ